MAGAHLGCSSALLVTVCAGILMHVAEASGAGEIPDFILRLRGGSPNHIQSGRSLWDGASLSRQVRDANRRACLLELQSEYRQIVGEHVKGRHAILVDMVEHMNLGDSFIQYGEQLLLEQMGTPIHTVCTWEHCDWGRLDRSIQEDPRPSVILVNGGGNFGDLWRHLEQHHNDIVRRYKQIPIVFLPQSVYYRKLESARTDAEEFSKHPNLQILVRDLNSLAFMRVHFSDHTSQLAPDSALNIGPLDGSVCEPQVDVLILARTDQEKANATGNMSLALKILEEKGRTYKTTEWWWCLPEQKMPEDVLDHARFKFEMGKRCLCQGRVVVTDRLHATILSTMLGLPHVYLDNEYGKIHKFRVAHFQPRPLCSDSNLRAHRAPTWYLAMKIANEILENDI